MNGSSLKNLIAARTEEIAGQHRAGADGFATCLSLTAMMDDVIQQAAAPLLMPGSQIAVLALGGYGRAELSPKSDIDLMILAEDGKGKGIAEQLAKQLLHLLWDTGLNVGHSVRTVKDALAQHGKAVDSWASMLESRFLCGNERLAQTLFAAVREKVAKEKDTWFTGGVFEEVRSRHERFGNSVKLLEPNLKKSAGGLRDFHSLLWLYRGNVPDYFFPIDPHASASRQFLAMMHAHGVLDSFEHNEVRASLQFLLRTRHEMHLRRTIASDTLEYTLQREIAEALGFGAKAELRSVEVFMHEYYLHARVIHRLYQNLSHRFREMIEPARYTFRGATKLNEVFLREGETLSVGPEVRRLTHPGQILEAFVFSAEYEIALHPRLRRVLAESAVTLTDEDRRSPELGSLFHRILASHRVGETLHDMNELDVLGVYLPEFGNLVAFFQHNLYHYFTADEHTLIAIANAEGLREQQNILHEVFRNLRRKDVLYLALLLHDIGKPQGVADHEISGVDIARRVLERIGMMDLFEDVAFLIRNHLVMEQFAFRRNIHDPALIGEFAARFDRPEQLDYLYVLTYADLSAVNTNVWTEWKSSLLQELYQLTSEVLNRNLKGSQIDAFKQARREEATDALVERLSASLPCAQVYEHLQGIQSDAYVGLFSDAEIREHIHKSASEETVSTLFAEQEGHTEITLISEDAPFALSKFCAVLSANDANIFDANIFTREDGIIIDRFRVSDASTHAGLKHSVCEKISKDLNDVMEGKLDIEHLFAAHRRKWKRRQKSPSNPNIRTDVQFEDNPRYTIIDVYAPDTLGFLYRVTEAISKLGLDIYSAKIATRVDGIVDAFYVLDRTGNRITDPAEQSVITTDILGVIRQTSEQELAAAVS